MVVSQRPTPASETPCAVALRVLWYALRAPGGDPPAAPGIDYSAPVVQSSPMPREPLMGACRVTPAQLVDGRLERAPAAARRTLCWVRSQGQCPTVSMVGRALAPQGDRERWARSTEAARVGPDRVGAELVAAAVAAWETTRA
jgi:hypothetical protein